ncbi:MAG: efflux RND transporter periplasmic adaptor subunit [Candidatus Aerophobetes bacterium]|nr:efflux RND transporter periplasmic adaptor subunit [Candidatus Aerophobetes bacterium]
MKKWILWIIIIAVVVVGGVFTIPKYLLNRPEEKSSTQGSLVVVKRGTITRIVSATGSLSPLKYGELKFDRAGRIKEVMVEEGDYVKEGQVLARLEDEQERFSLLQAENALKEAESELKKAKISSSKNVTQEKERKLKERELELQLKKKDLEDTVLKAPFSGAVSKIYVEKGEVASSANVSASSDILRLIDTSKLFADVSVDEVDISQVKIGQKVKIIVDAYLDEIFYGKVVEIAPETTISSGLVVVEVKIELEKANPKLKPGFTASADIIVGEAKDTLLLPVEAVNEKDGGKFVVIPGEGEEKPSYRPVITGISDGTNVEIKRGLKEEEKVLSSGLQKIIEMRRQMQAGEQKKGFPMMPGFRK